MFIQIENTPNPDTLKFLLSTNVSGVNSGAEFLNSYEAQESPLARLLFEIEGVSKVFFGVGFISVTKTDSVLWETLKPEVLVVMTDYLSVNGTHEEHTSADAEDEEVEFYDEKDLEVVQQVKELIENYVKPAVAQDGGDIKFRGYKEGIVFVRLRGACSGCPSAAVTLKDGVYGMLSYYIPEIKGIESI